MSQQTSSSEPLAYPGVNPRYGSQGNLNSVGQQNGARAKQPQGYPPSNPAGYPTSSNGKSYPSNHGNQQNYPAGDNRGYPDQRQQHGYPETAPKVHGHQGAPPKDKYPDSGYPEKRSRDQYPSQSDANKYPSRKEGHTNLAYDSSRENLAPQSGYPAPRGHPPTSANAQGVEAPQPPTRRSKGSDSRSQGGSSSSAPYSPSANPAPYNPNSPYSQPSAYPATPTTPQGKPPPSYPATPTTPKGRPPPSSYPETPTTPQGRPPPAASYPATPTTPQGRPPPSSYPATPTTPQGRPPPSSYPATPTTPQGRPPPAASYPATPTAPQGRPPPSYPTTPQGKPPTSYPTTPTSPQGKAPLSYPQPQPSRANSTSNIAQQGNAGVKYMSTSDLTMAISNAPLNEPQPQKVGHAQSMSTLTVPTNQSYPVVSNQPISTSPDGGKSPKTPTSGEEGDSKSGIRRKFKFQKNKNAQARPASTLSAAHMAQNAQLQRYSSKLSINSMPAGTQNTMNSQQGSQWSLNTISGTGVNMNQSGMQRSASMYSVASVRSVNIPRCGSFISLTTVNGETKIMSADTFESCFTPALITTILCFFPTGIVAILYANQAKKAYEEGDVIEGRRKADMARILVIVTVCIGMLLWILGIVALALVIMT